MSKHVLIMLLAGVNLFLLACVVLTAHSPPQAFAESTTNNNEYALLSAEADEGNDVIYLIDVRNQLMHALAPSSPDTAGQLQQVRHLHTRDLAQDFKKQRRRR